MSTATLQSVTALVRPSLEQFERYIRRVLRTPVPLLNLVLWYLFRRRGKRVRPALTFLSAAACGQITHRTFVGAAMVELLHTATLVHDDVVDRARERRGFPSVNALWSERIAVLVGDYLLARGLLLATQEREWEFLDITAGAVQQMSSAELRHVQLNRKLRLEREQYLEVIRGKTAALFAAACEIGAVSADAEPALRAALRRYGEDIGIAYQLVDDVLDYTGQQQLLGKPAWQDLREHKLTLPLLIALERMGSAERSEFLRRFRRQHNGADLRWMAQQVLRWGGVEATQELARHYGQCARHALEELPPSPARSALQEFAEFVLQRLW